MRKQNATGLRVQNKIKSPHALLSLCAIVLAMSLGLFSCKKDIQATANPAPSTPKLSVISGGSSYDGMTDAEIDAMVTQFHTDMNSLKDEKSSSDNITLKNAVFGVEAVYNKYDVKKAYDGSIALGEISVQLPANVDGTVNMKEVANAYWAINADLATQKDAIFTEDGNTPTLEALDLEAKLDQDGNIEVVNGNYTMLAHVAFRLGGVYIRDIYHFGQFNASPKKVWRSVSWADIQNNPQFTKGQAIIDYTTKELVPGSENNSQPAAASALRELGIQNYFTEYPMLPVSLLVTSYFTDIETITIYMDLNAVWHGFNIDYVIRGVPDYNNLDMWNTTKLTTPFVTEPYHTYKDWLSTPMMNYYVTYIKDYIHNNIPAGKEFSDFGIRTDYIIDNSQPDDVRHTYKVTSGRWVTPD